MTNDASTASQTRSQILEDAWLRFAKYDRNASIAQKRFIQQRKWILILGVTATTLAILYSDFKDFLPASLSAEFPTWINPKEGLHSIVVIVPIIITILVAFSVKFNMGINWVMLRTSAEALKRNFSLPHAGG